MTDSHLALSPRVLAFNSACRSRNIPLAIEHGRNRCLALRDTQTRRTVHLSRFDNVIVLLGIARALAVYHIDPLARGAHRREG